jgi:hypothetical protein
VGTIITVHLVPFTSEIVGSIHDIYVKESIVAKSHALRVGPTHWNVTSRLSHA